MRAVLTAFLIAYASTTLAADCLQGDARYTDEDKAYLMRFSGSASESRGMASNRFTMETTSGIELLKGWVNWSNGIARPYGTLTYNCPAGDITGDELDRCKIWEGVVYAIYPDGAVDLIPPDTDPAAHSLLLPDFGRRLKASKVWFDKKLNTVPWDKFTYSGCKKPH